MRSLARRMKTRAFDDSTPDGFVIDRVRDDFIEARYVERVSYTDKVVDPFGKELTFERIDFRQCGFRASTHGPGLELLNPPRSTQGLVSRLSEVSEFTLAVVALPVDVNSWATEFQRITHVDGIVDSIQIGAIELERGVFAKAVVRGSKDVREASRALTGARRYTLEKIQIRLRGSLQGSIVLTNTGGATLNTPDADNIIQALRESIPNALSAPS